MARNRPLLVLIILILLIIGGLVGLTWANYRFSEQNPGGNDFLARWMGARMWLMEGISPYDERVSLATQEIIYGHPADPSKGEDKNHFVYPLHSMIFFGPFGLLEYLPARALWMTLLELCMVALAILSMRLIDWEITPLRVVVLVLFSVLWYHGARTIIIGQFAGIGALLVTLALFLIIKKHDAAAGFVLALSTAKPQMVFLVILFILWWALSNQRWEILMGFFLTMAGLIIGFVILIPNWPLQMIWQIMDYPSYTQIGSPLSIIAEGVPGIERQLNVFLHLALELYLVFEWIMARGKGDRWFLWTAFLTLIVTNLVSLRTATTNYVIMLPIVFLIWRTWSQRWGKVGQGFVIGTMALLGVGLWVLFFSTVQGNEEAAAMYLPLPIFCLVGLWWMRWWVVRTIESSFVEEI